MFHNWDSHDLREVLNGTWFWLSVALAVTFGAFLVRRIANQINRRGASEPLWRSFWPIENQAALGLLIYFTGSTLYRAWTWTTLWAGTIDAEFLNRYHIIPVIGTITALVGALCCIRVFTPIHWNPWLWLSVGAFSIIVPVVFHFYP